MQNGERVCAIGYGRISIKDQSNYSLPYQQTSIQEYCQKNQLNLLAFFKDDGESSYTFDRPDWKALEDFVKQHKGKVKYLVIVDHDRFSRNLAEALQKIELLEKKFGVKIVSISEPLTIDTSDPVTFLNRAFKLMLANHELFNIRKRTRNGIRQALLSGRVVNNAPFGYINRRDEQGLPILEIDPEKAAIVKRVFEEFLQGTSAAEIYRGLKGGGVKLSGNSVITRMLCNHHYAGLIKVPPGNGEPAKMIRALHTPIISEAIYWKVQEIFTGKPRHRSIPVNEIPLRGVMRCQCGGALTGSYSKGKKRYYLYYTCMKERNRRYPGNRLHDIFYNILDGLSFSPQVLQAIIETSEQKMEEALKHRSTALTTKQSELADVQKKIDKLEERYMVRQTILPANRSGDADRKPKTIQRQQN